MDAASKRRHALFLGRIVAHKGIDVLFARTQTSRRSSRPALDHGYYDYLRQIIEDRSRDATFET
jgi:hypothetical protein